MRYRDVDMSRFIRALVISASATTVAAIVVALRRAQALKDKPARPPGGPQSSGDVLDELSDEDRASLVTELSEHV